jgi:hypothetical protein
MHVSPETDPARLFKNAVDLVLVFQFQHLGGLIMLNAFTIQEETDGRHLNALLRGVGLEDLAHLRRLLDLEERFFPVLKSREEREKGGGG